MFQEKLESTGAQVEPPKNCCANWILGEHVKNSSHTKTKSELYKISCVHTLKQESGIQDGFLSCFLMRNCFCHIAVKTATGKEEITMQYINSR